MGFLSGVLGAVKDENEVTTYDKYITDPEKRLNKALNTLKDSIGTGRTGLVASVEQVKRWLEGYEGEVGKKTKAVTGPLGELEKHISVLKIGINSMQEKPYESARETVMGWTNRVKELPKETEKSLDALKSLDKELNNNLEPHLNLINQAAHTFTQNTLHGHITFIKVCEEVRDKLDTVLTTTVHEYAEEANVAVKKAKTKFLEQINNNIDAVQREVLDVYARLQTWIVWATELLDPAIKKVTNVCKQLETDVENTALKTKIGKIDTANVGISAIATQLSKINNELNTWISTADNTMKSALENVDKILDEVDGGSKSKNKIAVYEAAAEIENQTSKLNTQFTTLNAKYNRVYEFIMGTQGNEKSGVVGNLNDLYEKLRLGVSKYEINDFETDSGLNLNGQITSLTGAIENNVKQFVEKLWNAVKAGIVNVGKTPQNPRVNALVSHLGEELKGLGQLGDVLTRAQKSPHGLGRALEMILSHMNANTSGISLPSSEDLLKSLQTAFETKAIAGIKNNQLKELIKTTADKGMEKLHSEIKQVLDRIPQHVTNDLQQLVSQAQHAKRELDTKSREINVKLGSLSDKMTGLAGYLRRYISQFKTANILGSADGQLTKLNTDLGAQQASLPTNTRSISEAIVDIKEELKGLKMTLNTDVITKLEELRETNISAKLQKNILESIKELNNTHLERLRCGVKGILTDAERAAIALVERTKQSMLNDIAETSISIRNEFIMQFVRFKKTELCNLMITVEEEQMKIKNIIAKSIINGPKGLLKWMRKGHGKFNLETMKSIVPPPAPLMQADPQLLKKLCDTFRSYSDILIEYTRSQINNSSKTPVPTDHSTKVADIKNAFDRFLKYVAHNNEAYHFDNVSNTYLYELIDSLNNLTPTFSPSPLLAPLKAGLSNFAQQLGLAYVNRYSGRKMGKLMDQKTVPDTEKKDPGATKTVTDLTPEGRNCAKVCLTIVEMLFHDLSQLKKGCKSVWEHEKLCLFDVTNGDKNENVLGTWFKGCGFKVPDDKSNQNGELDRIKKGKEIHALLYGMRANKYVFTLNPNTQEFSSLKKLHNHLDTYYRVSHLNHIEKPKAPSNIYQMLQWMLGLLYNPMFEKVRDYAKELFDKPKGEEEKKYADIEISKLKLSATTYFTWTNVKEQIEKVCIHSHAVLVAIKGNGHEGGRYAVDFYTNVDNLSYPSSSAACFDMFADILYRIYDQLYFLLVQCQRTSDTNSWRDCWYGRYVGGSSWTCNEKRCANQNCPQIAAQKANQNAQQIARQTCDEHPICGLKSPLQSFLEDGLQGFLPHSLTKVGCGVECSLGRHRGILCRTPMGFADICDTASHTQKGDHIMKVLQGFCGDTDKPLTKMCSYLLCLMQRPPQTLGDMFAFYYNLLNDWNSATKGRELTLKHKKIAFNEAVYKASFGFCDDLDVTGIFKSTAHATHPKGDLFSLYMCDYTDKSEVICGRYMHPFGMNTWTVFVEKHAGNYLSWIVYLTETFYDLLKQLYEECCNNCNKPGTRCYGKICVKGCKVESYYKSQESTTDTKTTSLTSTQQSHHKLCKSIANCTFTRPTLSKYGFVLQSPYNLSGSNYDESKRTCKDLCETLKRVLSTEKAKSDVLAKLVFETIPEFLFKIRAPFIWLNVALWLLSFLYLIHIMVIRLDLLHIKSHLHSPSSHRIAAQSLLAAGRVNKLGRVFYLQP